MVWLVAYWTGSGGVISNSACDNKDFNKKLSKKREIHTNWQYTKGVWGALCDIQIHTHWRYMKGVRRETAAVHSGDIYLSMPSGDTRGGEGRIHSDRGSGCHGMRTVPM